MKWIVRLLIAVFLVSTFLFVPPAKAQTKHHAKHHDEVSIVMQVRPTGNLIQDIKNATGGRLTGAVVTDLQNSFNARVLPDLKYALKLASASKNTITGDCYQAWIDIINTQQAAVQTKNSDGSTTDDPMPDPHVITEFEKLVELRNALQPESVFMVKCSPVASMIKKDIASFMGIVLAGGAGLATLVPGL